jgi:uncharacterized protein involved in outer membrane biogenesis
MPLTRFRKILLAAVAIVVVLGVGVYFWARSVLTGDAVRDAVQTQLSEALGQPVTIAKVGVSIFPRVTMDLDTVTIGKPARISARKLHVGTRLWALLSRRIENADLRLDGARIQLPLPPLGASKGPATAESAASPVTIVSIDEISLKDVEIVSGGRTIRGDATFAMQGSGVSLKQLVLGAGATKVTVAGEISNLSGPVGKLTLRASGLDVPELAAFLSDFSSGSGLGATSSPGGGRAPKSAMNLTIGMEADRANFGTLAVTDLKGQARVTPEAITMDPMRFGVFNGTYDGALRLTLADTPAFRLQAKIANINVGDAMAFAGSPNTVTGKAGGTLELTGRGTTAERVLNSVSGVARLEIKDGTVARLGMVRAVIVATAMRSEPKGPSGPGTEKFSRLGATFNMDSGVARTDDLQFESPDVLLAAKGTARLDGTKVEMGGPLQLSKELSSQAGPDLVRYTAKDGLVTVPITVTGPVTDLHVGVELSELAQRAILNRAREELKKGLGSALKKIIK